MDIEPVILVGHVLDRLRELPDNSVHCVVTSPPYWNLRDYGLPPVVWGGDPACEHEWGDLGIRHRGGPTGDSVVMEGRDTTAQDAAARTPRGHLCAKCHAWRGQLGLEPTPDLFVEHLVGIFREVRRVLRPDGVCWVNMGDTYCTNGKWGGSSRSGGIRVRSNGSLPYAAARAKNPDVPGLKAKDLVGMPWRVALALQADGWWLRSDNIWHKPTALPESVYDRTSRDHEYLFMLTKSARYFYDVEATKVEASGGSPGNKSHKGKTAYENGDKFQRTKVGLTKMVAVSHRHLRTVWRITSVPFKKAHFATFPPEIPLKCIKAGTSEKGCCPKCGAPWRRLLKKSRVATRPGLKTKVSVDRQTGEYLPLADKPWAAAEVGNRDPLRHISVSETVGWEPTCKCGEEASVPCTILDPFAGAGTTPMMAEYLGRNWIGIELNEEYAEIARERIAAGYTPPKKKGARRRKHRSQGTQKEMF